MHELKLFTAYFLVLELAIAACCLFFLPYVSVYEGLTTPTTLNWSMHNCHCGAKFASFFSAWWNWHPQHRLLKSNNFKFTVYKTWLQLVLAQSMVTTLSMYLQMSCHQLAIYRNGFIRYKTDSCVLWFLPKTVFNQTSQFPSDNLLVDFIVRGSKKQSICTYNA